MSSKRREKPRGERRRRNRRSDDDDEKEKDHNRYNNESSKDWEDRGRDPNQSSTNNHNGHRRRSRNSRSPQPHHNHDDEQDRRKRRRKSSRKRSRDRDRYDGSYSPSRRNYDDHDHDHDNNNNNNKRHHDKEEIRRYDDYDRNSDNDRKTRQQRQRRRRSNNNHSRRRNDNHYRNNSPRRRRRRRRRSHNSTQQQNLVVDVNVGGADVIPVSDDDDYGHNSNHHQSSTTAAPITMAAANSDDHNNHRKDNSNSNSNNNNNNNNKINNNNNNNSNKNSSPPAHQDDTIGHFKGRAGCVIADRYRLLKEVGMGTFGRVVQCLDLSRQRRVVDHNNYRQQQRQRHDNHDDHPNNNNNNNNNIVAIKIVRNVKRYYESAIIEADIIEDVNRRGRRGRTHCSILYDTFSFHGHYCMVLESLGPSLYDFLKGQKYQPFPIYCVRDFAEQLLETLEYLHSFRLIHTDLKPENILLLNGREIPQRGGYSIPESTRIKVIDFGGATYDNEKKSTIVNTRQYRAPEVILNVGWGCPSDIWSVGCILAELYQGELLFATHDNIEHLALIEQVIGPFPRRMLKRAKNVELVNEAFDSNGAHRMVLPTEKLAYVKRTPPLESIVYDEDEWFLRLLRRILVIDPDERLEAHQLLRFLEKYARPKFRQGGDVNRW